MTFLLYRRNHNLKIFLQIAANKHLISKYDSLRASSPFRVSSEMSRDRLVSRAVCAWLLTTSLRSKATTSCKIVDTRRRKNSLSYFKPLLVTRLWDIILASGLLPSIRSCSTNFWACSCIASNFDKGRRGISQAQNHKQATQAKIRDSVWRFFFFFFAADCSSQSMNITVRSIVHAFPQQLRLFRQLKPLLNPTLEAIKLSLEATELVPDGFRRVPRIKLTRSVPTALTNKANA